MSSLSPPASCPLDGRTGKADNRSHTTGTMTRTAGGSSTTVRPRAAGTVRHRCPGGSADHGGVHSPVHAARVHDGAGFYDSAGLCDRCDVTYCRGHRNVTTPGTGTRPPGPHQEPGLALATQHDW
jgi:hypothetical protein